MTSHEQFGAEQLDGPIVRVESDVLDDDGGRAYYWPGDAPDHCVLAQITGESVKDVPTSLRALGVRPSGDLLRAIDFLDNGPGDGHDVRLVQSLAACFGFQLRVVTWT